MSRALADLLRRAVLDHATTERRRVFPGSLQVGVPGLVSTRIELREPFDPTLRVDVVEAMVRRVRRPGPPPLVWLTRQGPIGVVQDSDLAWSAAAWTAAAELGTVLAMVVVDRRGWRDPRTGVGRDWQRLRLRGPTRSDPSGP